MLKLTVSHAAALPAVPADADVWTNREGTAVVYGYTQGGEHWISLPDVAAFRFSAPSAAVSAIALEDASDGLVEHLFLKRVLPLALQALGSEVLHASAVLAPHGALVLAGPSGAGKSTLAYGLMGRGYATLADDAVALEPVDRRIRALPLPPFAIDLEPESLAFFTTRAELHANGTPREEREGVPVDLAALLVLERRPPPDGAPFAITRLAPKAAFRAALSQAFCFSPRDAARRRVMLERFLALASSVPVFEVRYAPDFDRLPELLDALEQAVQ